MGLETALAIGLGTALATATSVAVPALVGGGGGASEMPDLTPEVTPEEAPQVVPTEDQGRTAAQQQALIATSPQGILDPAPTRRKRLLGG